MKYRYVAPSLMALACNPAPDEVDEVTWHQHARPIVQTYCASCHKPDGMAPFALTELEQVRQWSEAVRASVESGEMPPWKPSALAPLRFDRSLRPEDQALLLAWLEQGLPEGDPAGPVREVEPLEELPPVRPDRVLQPAQALTLSEPGDLYWCFPLGEPEQAVAHFRSVEMRPGNEAVVHHIAFYEVASFDLPTISGRDEAEPGPGYPCNGSGPGGIMPLYLFGWTPGGTAVPSPEGAPYRVSAGSQLVMEVHYNVPPERVGEQDLTSVVLETYDGVPSSIFLQVPLADYAMVIPPDTLGAEAGTSVSAAEIAAALQLEQVHLQSVLPHMHTRGRVLSLETGGESFFEIPDWDFHWQQTYYFRDPVALPAGSELRLRCTFDNETDEEVRWGERTQDEMCVGVLGIVTDSSVDVLEALMALYY
jgi:hypothetical protein